MTTRETQVTPAKACRNCKHEFVDKGKFCDNCGAATTALVSDWETLQHYCGRCGGVLRGDKKYCSYCGDPSPHSGKKQVKHEHWVFQAAEDPKIQITVVATLVLLASLPLFLPVRYGLTLTPPFFLVSEDGNAPAVVRPAAPLATATWSARSLTTAEDATGRNAVASVTGAASNASGIFFLADASQHAIFRVSPDGARELVAGGGQPGFSGDGGAAIEATLNSPGGLATDSQGNLYIADTGNGRIRVIDAEGVIRTIAGCGLDCEAPQTSEAAALAVSMRPEALSFVGSTLLVAEQSSADAQPTLWFLRPAR